MRITRIKVNLNENRSHIGVYITDAPKQAHLI
jgi:hypothetical protein